MDPVFALVDCENFYVSCERVFDPSLRGRPVAVLSNNDSCIIARSEALKAAGFPMGAPYFKWKRRLGRMGAAVRSSNYALYGDMSRRVMTELEAEALAVERYSIDEAFLTLPAVGRADLDNIAWRLQKKIRRRQGVPIRVGIGPTKTLAKVADAVAKRRKRAGTGRGTFVCPPEPDLAGVLETIPVGDIWGIGPAYEAKLGEKGVTTAEEFRHLPSRWIRRAMTVQGLRTALELQGRSCLQLETVRPTRKTLVRSRSFAGRVTDANQLREAVAKHTQRAAEKLREESLVARGLQVFLRAGRFGPGPRYANAAAGTLPAHTADPRPLLKAARQLLGAIYRKRARGRPIRYKKAGVLLYDLRPSEARQESLFPCGSTPDPALVEAMDQVNEAMGRGTVGFASAGLEGKRRWAMQRKWRSPRYTTRWAELPIAGT